MKALILAAGLGTRLKSITETTPKVLALIGGRPLLNHQLDQLREIGITEILINTHYLSSQVENFCKDYCKKNNGIRITTTYEKTLLGNAGTMIANQFFFNDEEDFLIIYGDVFTNLNYKDLIRYHRNHDSLATIVCSQVENIQEKGMVVFDEKDTITTFKEKPTREEIVSFYANSGIYVFKTTILKQLKEITKKRPLDFGKDVFPFMLAHDLPLLIYKLTDWLIDIGDPESYRLANNKIKELNL